MRVGGEPGLLIAPALSYDLRHTFATLMFSNGEHPKIVQEILGHAQITLTLDTYSHVLPSMQEGAVGRMGELLD
jgi:site-specific recombinase XerD